jgi:hypothetical protein
MEKFIHLNVSHLRLDNLAGLCNETVAIATPQAPNLGVVGEAKLQQLTIATTTLTALLDKVQGSAITPQIAAEDRHRDQNFTETKRTAKTAQKSTLPDKAAAGTLLMTLLKPFWNINKEPILSQTTQINIFRERFNADPNAPAAAETLGLTPVIADLFAANDNLMLLYNLRLDETAHRDGPSASSVKDDAVVAYDEFCGAVEMTLSALPSGSLQYVFNEMNDVRRKYIRHLPKDLSVGDHCVIEPLGTQPFTGKAVTPIPHAHWREENKPTVELVFAKDFSVTYKNNVKIGMAELTIHGKGNYKGQKTATFNIAR